MEVDDSIPVVRGAQYFRRPPSEFFQALRDAVDNRVDESIKKLAKYIQTSTSKIASNEDIEKVCLSLVYGLYSV